MRRRNVDDVKQAVCGNQAPFQCLLQPQNVGRCRPIFEKAKQFGLPLPESRAALSSQCSQHAMENAVPMVAVPPAPVNVEVSEAGVVEVADTCSMGFVGLIAAQAPGCLDPCKPAVCTAVGSAIGAYMRRRNVEDVKQAVCANQAPFQCLLQPQNVGRCRPIFEKAKHFGLPLPESRA